MIDLTLDILTKSPQQGPCNTRDTADERDLHQNNEASSCIKRLKTNHDQADCPAREYDVVLVSNCYYLRTNDANSSKKLYAYDIKYSIINMSYLSAGFKALTEYLEDMSDGVVPFRLAKIILDTAIDRWTSQMGNTDDRLFRYDHDYNVLMTDFDLLAEKPVGSETVVKVPFILGKMPQPALKFVIRLRKTQAKDLSRILNLFVEPDARPSPSPFVHRSSDGMSYVKFDPADRIDITLPDGARVLHGKKIQFELMSIEPALSITNTTGMFLEPLEGVQNMVDYLRLNYKLFGLDEQLDESIIENLNRRLKYRHVEVSHLRIFDLPIQSIVGKIAGTAHQPWQIEPKLSILEYLMTIGIQLKYPNLPCVELDFNGDEHKIPMELCYLAEGHRTHFMNYGVTKTSELQEKSKLKPHDYFDRIESYVQEVADTNASSLKMMGVVFDPERDQIKLIGRVLAPTWLRAGSNEMIKPKGGKYDTRGAEFLRPVRLTKFCLTWISNTADDSRESSALRDAYLARFYREYCRVGRSKGVQIDSYDVQIKVILEADDEMMDKKLTQHVDQLNTQQADHAVMIVPDDCDDITRFLYYLETDPKFESGEEAIGRKTRMSCLRLADLEMILNELESGDDSSMQSLWMKFNVQLGGVSYAPAANNLLKLPIDDLLILGFYVDEKSGYDDWDKPIAAMVGLWSATGGEYSHRVEILATSPNIGERIEDLKSMGDRILESYFKRKDQRLPSNLLILREVEQKDGSVVIGAAEMQRIRNQWLIKYDEVDQGPPKVSYATIQRQHNIRFKMSSPVEVEGDADCQMPPGTVVDSPLFGADGFAYSVPNLLDAEDTKVPIIVRRLMDEIPMTTREFQRLILALCYPTRLPIPVHLARLAVDRGQDIGYFKHVNSTPDQANQLNEHFSQLGDDYLDTMFYLT